MMRMMKFFLLSAAAVAAVSCAKENLPTTNENPTPEVELVPMTFTASYDEEPESKVAYEDKATVWKAGDKIMLISSTGIATEFTATSVDGKNATFNGLAEKSETYYAVSPASAYIGNDIANGKIYANIPETQNAVAGSFDPKAFLSVASNSGSELYFKNSCSVVGFKLSAPAGVKSVRFTATNQTNLAGTGVVKTSNIPTHTWDGSYAGRSAFDMITLNAPEGGFLADTDYYLTIRANTCPNGIKVYVEYEDQVKSRNSENPLFPSDVHPANKIRNLGQLDKNLGDVTPYDSYNLGADLVVAGKAYSPAALGTATLVSESTTISANGVYFIAEGVDIQISKGPYSKLFIVGNSPDSKTKITLTEQFRYSTNGVIGLKNLAFTQYNSDMFVHNNTAEATRFAFDNCDIIMPTSNGVMYNGASRTLAEFAMHNCDIAVSLDDQVFLRTSANYLNIDLHNNIFYSADGDKLNFYIINYTSDIVDNLKITQNTFANVYNITSAGGQNPYINVASVANYTLENNLFYLERYNSYKNPTSWILSCVPTAYVVNNNMLFKDINNQRLQVYKGGAYTAYTATKANVVTGEVDLTVPTIVPATTAGATR